MSESAAGRRAVGTGVLVVVLALLPFVLPNAFYVDTAIRIAIHAVVVIGLNLLVGYAGQISLGHAGFFGIGAYASAILTSRYGLDPLLGIAAGAAVSALLALLVARPILRLRGHYLAMATLGLGIIVSIVLVNENAYTGGPDGMTVPPLTLFGMEVSGERRWYALVAVLLVLATIAARNLVDSPAGRALRAIRGSETAARVAGIDVTRAKVRVFVLSAAVASAMGSLMAHYVGFVTPGLASFFQSIEFVTMVVLGGMASVFGSIVGAALLTMLPQALSVFEGLETLVFGLILMGTMILLPRGIVPTIAQRLARRPR